MKRYVVGVVVLIGLVLLIWHDLRQYLPLLPDLWLRVSGTAVLILILLQLASYALSASISYFLLRVIGARIQFSKALRVAVIAELGAGLIPIAGGPTVSYFAFRKFGVEKKIAAFTVGAETGLLALTYVTFFLLSLFLPPYRQIDAITARYLFAGAIILAIIIGILYLLRKGVKKYIEPALVAWRVCVAHPYKFLWIFLLSLAYFFVDVLMLFSAFHTFGAAPGIGTVIFGMLSASAFVLVSNSGLLPGVPEATLVFAFSKLGILPHIALSAALLYRVVTYWIWVPLSFIFMSHTWKWLSQNNSEL